MRDIQKIILNFFTEKMKKKDMQQMGTVYRWFILVPQLQFSLRSISIVISGPGSPQEQADLDMEVSWNGGYPQKWMVYKGKYH